MAMILLALGHAENAVGGPGSRPLELLKGSRRRERSRPLARDDALGRIRLDRSWLPRLRRGSPFGEISLHTWGNLLSTDLHVLQLGVFEVPNGSVQVFPYRAPIAVDRQRVGSVRRQLANPVEGRPGP